ncbi:hypothetical protein TSUD_152870 [Trifolium subterraneum]|uniref:Uncharacterized protein n=1 Tax=Trifolium subterraneum TaxID=3900 RepID=A0A2Z6MJW4_TRISU|nr:hypothetical protein TSUD_152870 [Trifolium subterraneum]
MQENEGLLKAIRYEQDVVILNRLVMVARRPHIIGWMKITWMGLIGRMGALGLLDSLVEVEGNARWSGFDSIDLNADSLSIAKVIQ